MKNDFIINRVEEAKQALILAKATCISAAIHITVADLSPEDVMGYAKALQVDLWNPTETIPYYWIRISTDYGIIIVKSRDIKPVNSIAINSINEQ